MATWSLSSSPIGRKKKTSPEEAMKIPDQFLAWFPSRLTQTFPIKYDTVVYRVHLWKNHKKV